MIESGDKPAGESHTQDDVVVLEPYDVRWPERAAAEAGLLKSADLPGWHALEHVGSTAVPGMRAKPIIDLALAVTCEASHPELIAGLVRLGYRHLGEFGLPGREFFRKGQPTSVHLHVVKVGSEHWDAWVRLRDFLRTSPEWLRRYEQEKARLADAYGNNRPAYTRAKGEIVQRILEAAGKPDS